MEKEISIEIKKPEIIVLLGLLVVILIGELLVTINSPIAFGDEGYHTRMAQEIAKNVEYPVWTGIEDTKIFKSGFARLPLFEILEGSFLLIFGFHEIIIKVLTPFIGSILIGLAVFLLGKKIYGKEVGFIAALIMVMIPSFVTYSVLFYTDILFTFYFSLFILTFILAITKDEKKYFILAGIFGALSLLAKTPGFVIFPLIFLSFLYEVYKRKNISILVKNYFIVVLLVVLISGPFFLRSFVYYHTLSCDLPVLNRKGCEITFDYKTTNKFEDTVEKVGTEVNIFQMGIVNYLNFAYGNIWFVPFITICGLILFVSRRRIDDIIVILAIISFLPVIYMSIPVRAEDFARWTLGIVVIIGLIAANYLKGIYDFVRAYHRYLVIIVVLFVIILSFINLQEKLATMKQVKQFSPLFFEACNFIKQNTSENSLLMTVWDHATVYNCQRNVATFGGYPDSADIVLSGNLNLTLSRLKAHGVTDIFIQKFSLTDKNLSRSYPISFIQFLEKNTDHFVKIYENGPSLQQCIQQSGCDGTIVYEIKY